MAAWSIDEGEAARRSRGGQGVAWIGAQTEAQANYDKAEDHFRHERYSEAAKYYKKAAAGWPDSALEQDAMFKLGESYFFSEQYAKASRFLDPARRPPFTRMGVGRSSAM